MDVVGRSHELAQVEGLLDGLASGPAQLVLVGEPGIGKSTLWEAGVAAAARRGFRVLTARPTRSESSLAYNGLSDLLAGVEEGAFASLPEPQRVALDVALLRTAAERPADSRAVFAGFKSVVSTLAAEQPVVVAVDDLQWLDGPTARALEFAGRRLNDAPVGLLAAARIEGGEVAGHTDWLSEQDRLRLRPLTAGALHQLVKERLGLALLRPTLLRLHGACGGNAFFALELARALVAGNVLEAGETWPLTDDVRELVDARLAALPASERAALLLAAAASQPVVEAGEVEAATRAGLVQVDQAGRVRFAHPLYASAVYGGAAADERRRVHAELAERGNALERAHHLALATEHPDAAVAAELDRAAELAVLRGAPEIAAELAERAAELTPQGDPAAGGRLLGAAALYLHAGALTRANGILDRLEDDPVLRGRALHLRALLRFREENFVEVVALLHEVVAHAEGGTLLRTAAELDLALTGIIVAYDHGPARIHAAAAVEHAERCGDTGLLAAALAVKTLVEFLLGEGLDEEQLARALELEDPVAQLQLEARPTTIAGCLALYTGRIDRAAALLGSIRESMYERGAEADLPLVSIHLAWLELAIGRWSEARKLSDEALQLASLTGTLNAHALAFAALLDAYAGEEESCRTRTAAALAAMGKAEYCLVADWAAWSIGLLEISLGNAAAAGAALESHACEAGGHEIVEPLHLAFVPDEVEALVVLGDVERAERLTLLLAAMGERFERPVTQAVGERCRGLVLAARGDLDGAAGALQASLAHLERAPAPFEIARTLLLLGQVERRRKQKAAARAALERCAAILEELGAKLWLERARAELARLGERREPGELTPTEARVAELAAAGMTNREIATAAFMSEKTVEANLSRVYRKLGIRSRAQIALRLVRQ